MPGSLQQSPATPARQWLVHCQQSLLCLHGSPWLTSVPAGLPLLGETWLNQQVQILEAQTKPEQLPEGYSWLGLRHFLQATPECFALLGRASQLGSWLREHRFCGSCGTRLQPLPSEHGMQCPNCQLQAWPRLSPSIIVLVTRGSDLLLARSPRFRNGMYSVLAGFVEPGESIEQCVHREVQEEVGLQIRNLRYITSQSWPFPHSLMLGFHAEHAAGNIVPQPEEIEDAAWFSPGALPPLPPHGSISRYLIELHLQRHGLGSPQPPR